MCHSASRGSAWPCAGRQVGRRRCLRTAPSSKDLREDLLERRIHPGRERERGGIGGPRRLGGGRATIQLAGNVAAGVSEQRAQTVVLGFVPGEEGRRPAAPEGGRARPGELRGRADAVGEVQGRVRDGPRPDEARPIGPPRRAVEEGAVRAATCAWSRVSKVGSQAISRLTRRSTTAPAPSGRRSGRGGRGESTIVEMVGLRHGLDGEEARRCRRPVDHGRRRGERRLRHEAADRDGPRLSRRARNCRA